MRCARPVTRRTTRARTRSGSRSSPPVTPATVRLVVEPASRSVDRLDAAGLQGGPCQAGRATVGGPCQARRSKRAPAAVSRGLFSFVRQSAAWIVAPGLSARRKAARNHDLEILLRRPSADGAAHTKFLTLSRAASEHASDDRAVAFPRLRPRWSAR